MSFTQEVTKKKMTYGSIFFLLRCQACETRLTMSIVRLGNSGLKVSRIILGLMSYGSSEWAKWVLDEEEGIAHIKAA